MSKPRGPVHTRTSQRPVMAMETADKGVFMSKVGSVQRQPENTDESGIIIIILWLSEQPSGFSLFVF